MTSLKSSIPHPVKAPLPGAENTGAGQEPSLRDLIHNSLSRYFEQIDGQPVHNLYEMVMHEVEGPLIEAVLQYAGNNQSKASIMLGMNRGTLRKKLQQYGLL